MSFYTKLLSISREKDSLLCIGLDTDIKKIPQFLLNNDNPVYEFNSIIIKSTKDIACAYKINLAFYESQGKKGWDALERTLDAIPTNIITIADAKRGDIGNSSELYARAFFENFNFDAVTVNPLLGIDSVKPFLDYKEKGTFILTLTSNAGSADFQYLKVENKPLYFKIIEKICEWNTNNNCGLVVGATHPGELKQIRDLVPDYPILIPGIGAQGGELESTIKNGCNENGEMAIINISRAVIYASKEKDFGETAHKISLDYNNKINQFRKNV